MTHDTDPKQRRSHAPGTEEEPTNPECTYTLSFFGDRAIDIIRQNQLGMFIVFIDFALPTRLL